MHDRTFVWWNTFISALSYCIESFCECHDFLLEIRFATGPPASQYQVVTVWEFASQRYHSSISEENALGRDFRQPPHLGFQRRDALIALTECCCNIGGLEVLRAIRISSSDGVTCSAPAL